MAIEFSDAKRVAIEHLGKIESNIGQSLSILEDETIEESFGWVFFYNTTEYVLTKDELCALAGNAPFIIDRKSGGVHITGTAEPVETYIAEFKDRWTPN